MMGSDSAQATGEHEQRGPHRPFIEHGAELTPEVLISQEEQFLALLHQIMNEAARQGATMRVIGSLAFRLACPDHKHVEYDNKRYLTDVDFIAYSREIDKVQDAFFALGWTENQNVLRLFGDKRRIFYHPTEPVHSDIFIDKLRFCHEIDFRGRLEIEDVTISLVDLLLEKLQIVEINSKDVVDIMVLLRQHEISEDGADQHLIDGAHLTRLCSRDWGLWRTATMNLRNARGCANEYLDPEDAHIVLRRIHILERLIEDAPKSLAWKARSAVGERVKWYREVEEVQRD